ncbi:MAG: hypothetical protein A2138_17080 [Deltaproteobacteria bacterium RBG_16_71_12]|nr:MAG: hypothetical protein A2138_17080 [Deltaproteobacteria bacterium RBG_16_71_12]
MFERPHHRRIALVLHALDGDLLARHRCYFGGGTAIALGHGEYRESVDIDLLVDSAEGYRSLRELVRAPAGLHALGRGGRLPASAQAPRIDQHGIRSFVDIDGIAIKLEIVREARVTFETPGPDDVVCGAPRLTLRDLATSKLLANADRHADDSVFSRDLIDLAMMTLPRRALVAAKAKAAVAYGSVERDLVAAVERLRERRGRLETCLQALRMTVPLALVWQRIRRLPERA